MMPRFLRHWRALTVLGVIAGVVIVVPLTLVRGQDGVPVSADGTITEAADGTLAATFPYDPLAYAAVQRLRETPVLAGWEGFPYVEGVVGDAWVAASPERSDAAGLVAFATRHWSELRGLSGIDEWVYDFGTAARARAVGTALAGRGRLLSGLEVRNEGGALRASDAVLPDGLRQVRWFWVLVEDHFVYVVGIQSVDPERWMATLNALSHARFERDLVDAVVTPVTSTTAPTATTSTSVPTLDAPSTTTTVPQLPADPDASAATTIPDMTTTGEAQAAPITTTTTTGP